MNPLGVAPDRVAAELAAGRAGPRPAQTGYHGGGASRRAGGEAPLLGQRPGRLSGYAGIAYQGHPLARGGRYTWRVRVWDDDQQVSAWSEPARFEVELDPAEGWRASWIGLGPIREEFRAAVR